MGIIQRQSIKNSFVNYIGVAIGAVSTIFIYPLLGAERLGIVQFFMTAVAFLVPFTAFGLPAVSVQFFSIFKNDTRKESTLLTTLMGFMGLTCIFILGLIYVFQDFFAGLFKQNAYLFSPYLNIIAVSTILFSFSTLFYTYAANYGRIAIPSVFFNLLQKAVQPILILLFIGGFIAFNGIFYGLMLGFGISMLGLFFYLKKISDWSFVFDKTVFDKKLVRQMLQFGLFCISINLSSTMAMMLDRILIGMFIGAAPVAIFTIPNFVAEAIDVPRRAISGITAPIISEAMRLENYEKVAEIYKKSALTQLIVGVYLLAGVWSCIDFVYQIMPNGDQFVSGKYVVLILGLVKLVDMATGVNSEIISYSKYYMFNLYALIVLAVLNIGLNLYLINEYQIIGAAFATLISMVIFNSLKLIFIYKKIQIQPFQKEMLYVLTFALLAWFTASVVPNTPSVYLNILMKGVIVTLIFAFLIIKFKISPDVNGLFDKLLNNYK